MVQYKLYIRGMQNEADAAIRYNEDGTTTSFIFDPNVLAYQQYLEWLAEGNTPLPPDPQNQPANGGNDAA